VPLQLGSRTAVLSGIVTAEETEPLAAWLRAREGAKTPVRVNLATCTELHTAALQALLAARVQLSVHPVDAFLRAWVAPLLDRVPSRTPADAVGIPGKREASA